MPARVRHTPRGTLAWATGLVLALFLWIAPTAAPATIRSPLSALAPAAAAREGPAPPGQSGPADDEAAESVPQPPATVYAADTCPEVFGTLRQWADNAARRRQVLEDVYIDPHCANITYRAADWERPLPLESARIALIDVTARVPQPHLPPHPASKAPPARMQPLDAGSYRVTAHPMTGPDPHAVLALTDAEHLGCPSGLYAVPVDASLGERTAVLAVFEDTMLVEHDGALRYMITASATAPGWRMYWHPPISLPRPRIVSKPPPRAPRRGSQSRRNLRR